MHSNFFKGTVDSLQREEGLTKIRKVKELSTLAEQGELIENTWRPFSRLTARANRAWLFSRSPGFGLGRKESQHQHYHPWCIKTRTGSRQLEGPRGNPQVDAEDPGPD